MMPQYYPELLSVALPAIVTAFLPSFIAPSFTSKFIAFSLLLWLARELRLFVREYLIGRQAQACGASLAPRVHSALPLGLSIIRRRVQIFTTGTPESLLEDFQAFPKGTKVIRAQYLGGEIITTRSHLDAKHMFSKGFSIYSRPPGMSAAFEPLAGRGIFFSEQRGTWSHQRSLLRPHFYHIRIADFSACEEHADRLVQWLNEKAITQEAVEMKDVFQRFSLTVASQHIFGQCVDALNALFGDREPKAGSTDTARFSDDFKHTLNRILLLMLLPSFVMEFMNSSIFPTIVMPRKSFKGVFEVVDALLANAEEKALEDHEDGHSEHLIEHLRRAGCSNKLIRHEAMSMLVASRDTTSSVLTSCIYELAGRDELWKKLRAEVSHLHGSSISYDEVRKLKLLRAVLNEVLRLHPATWMGFRYAYEDDVLPSGVFVPAGTRCNFCIRDFQRSPELWGKDADNFDPERWLDGRQALQSEDPFIFQPFGSGPRACIGQQFARAEVLITLVKLLQAFSGAKLVAPRDSIKEAPTIILTFSGDLYVQFQK